LIDNNKGYYAAKLLYPDNRTVTPSTRNFEPSFGVQWKRTADENKFRPFVSMDTRLKTIYNYDKPSPSSPDEWQASVNFLAGVYGTGGGRWKDRQPHFYFRFYHGVNPAGQFRSQRDHKLIGVGMDIPL